MTSNVDFTPTSLMHSTTSAAIDFLPKHGPFCALGRPVRPVDEGSSSAGNGDGTVPGGLVLGSSLLHNREGKPCVNWDLRQHW